MNGPIDEACVRRIARLARLEISDDEVQLYTAQLERIVSYVEQLNEVDTDGVEPLANPLAAGRVGRHENVVREDEPQAGLPTDQALANAPQREGDFFRVPAVQPGSQGA